MVGRTKATRVWIFVEGGGSSRDEQTAIRRGFSNLFEKILDHRSKPSVIASGGRDQAYKDWCRALKTNPDVLSLLLVDSEGPVAEGKDPWDHVQCRKGDEHWSKPRDLSDERLYLMVQAMEAWFFADRDALVAYYGSKDFQISALPKRDDIENIPKEDLKKTLARASRNTKKGSYTEAHGFELIGRIDPLSVRMLSPHATRFFDRLVALCPPLK